MVAVSLKPWENCIVYHKEVIYQCGLHSDLTTCCACSHFCSVCLSCSCVPTAENVPAILCFLMQKSGVLQGSFLQQLKQTGHLRKQERKEVDWARRGPFPPSWIGWFLSSAAHFGGWTCTSFSAKTSICWFQLTGVSCSWKSTAEGRRRRRRDPFLTLSLVGCSCGPHLTEVSGLVIFVGLSGV